MNFGAQTEVLKTGANYLFEGASLLSDDPPSAIPDGAPAAVNKKADTSPSAPSPEPTPPPPSEDALTVEEWTHCLCVLDPRGPTAPEALSADLRHAASDALSAARRAAQPRLWTAWDALAARKLQRFARSIKCTRELEAASLAAQPDDDALARDGDDPAKKFAAARRGDAAVAWLPPGAAGEPRAPPEADAPAAAPTSTPPDLGAGGAALSLAMSLLGAACGDKSTAPPAETSRSCTECKAAWSQWAQPPSQHRLPPSRKGSSQAASAISCTSRPTRATARRLVHKR